MSSSSSTALTVTVAGAAAIGTFLWLRLRNEKSPFFKRIRTASVFSSRQGQAPGEPIVNGSSSSSTSSEDLWESSGAENEPSLSWITPGVKLPGAKFDLLHRGYGKGGKLLVVTVGLPGRGKTYIARKVARYLRWISYRTRVFSLAKYRLEKVGSKGADFFDPTREEHSQQRVRVFTEALEDSLRYLNRGGEIAILDGTNTTRERRNLIKERVAREDGYDILWIESSWSDVALSDDQFEDLKNSPDFIDKLDYERRLEHYRASYETLTEADGAFIRVNDKGSTMLTLHAIHGFLPTKIVSFVMNLKPRPSPLYICRHGESAYNVRGLVGGDSSLSPKGIKFSKALGEHIEAGGLETSAANLNVWTSTMKRCRETAAEIHGVRRVVEWRTLREIEVGVCDGLSYEQIKARFPDEYHSRHLDKLRYRYPRGESYLDVIVRLEPVIFEVERCEEPLIIIGHQAVLRCLYAYFLDLPAEEIPFLSIPLHTLIRLETKAYGCKEKRVRIVIDAPPSTQASSPDSNPKAHIQSSALNAGGSPSSSSSRSRGEVVGVRMQIGEKNGEKEGGNGARAAGGTDA